MPVAERFSLWPQGVVPLVGAGAEEDRIELEAWCRRFADECEASAAGSEAGNMSDAESLVANSPSSSSRTPATAYSNEPPRITPWFRGWPKSRRRAVLVGGLIAALAFLVAMVWMLCRRGSSRGQDSLTTTVRGSSPPFTQLQELHADSLPLPASPRPQVPHYVNHYNGSNPLRIRSHPARRDNYFLIVGDWGKAAGPGSCQYAMAELLQSYVRRQQEAGKNLLFVGSVGDNFYRTGVAGNARQTSWAEPNGTIADSSPTYSAPWLVTLGNHDYGNSDPYAFCPDVKPQAYIQGQAYAGQQLNQDRNPRRHNFTRRFWFPDYNYHYEIPEVDLEVIAMDTNGMVDPSLLGGDWQGRAAADDLCGGVAVSATFLQTVAEAGRALLVERARAGTARTILILQHYPGLCQRDIFEQALPAWRKDVRILCAYGHSRGQRCEGYDAAGRCVDILTGGGGGCCAPEVDPAGFTSVHLDDYGNAKVDMESAEVRVAQGSCNV